MLKTQKSDLRTAVEGNIQSLEARQTYLEKKPTEFIAGKIRAIDRTLPNLYQGPPDDPDNVTMKQHLQNVKSRMETDPDAVIQEEKQRVEDSLQRERERKQEIIGGVTSGN